MLPQVLSNRRIEAGVLLLHQANARNGISTFQNPRLDRLIPSETTPVLASAFAAPSPIFAKKQLPPIGEVNRLVVFYQLPKRV